MKRYQPLFEEIDQKQIVTAFRKAGYFVNKIEPLKIGSKGKDWIIYLNGSPMNQLTLSLNEKGILTIEDFDGSTILGNNVFDIIKNLKKFRPQGKLLSK